jgi:hypothetical protein
MSGSHVRGWLASVVALVSVPWLGLSGAQGPEDDLLAQVRKQQQVAAQKLESDVQGVLKESVAGARTNPARTADLLRFFLTQINDTPSLSADKRASLRQQVQARLNQIEATLRTQPAAQDRQARQEADRNRFKPPPEEKNPPVAGSYKAATDRYRDMNKQIASRDSFRKERDRGVVGALKADNVPPDRDVTFPKNWKDVIAKRPVGPKLTEREQELIRMLSSVMSVDYRNAKFREVIEDIAERTKQTILLDKDSMREAMVEYDTPVSLKLDKVTVRTVLKKLLADNGLGFIVKDGVLQVVSDQKARNTLSTRVYPVSDLVAAANPFNTPFMSMLQMRQNAATLIALIQTTVEPSSWQANGGPGTIFFNEATMSLVVRQTTEFHLTFQMSTYGR